VKVFVGNRKRGEWLAADTEATHRPPSLSAERRGTDPATYVLWIFRRLDDEESPARYVRLALSDAERLELIALLQRSCGTFAPSPAEALLSSGDKLCIAAERLSAKRGGGK